MKAKLGKLISIMMLSTLFMITCYGAAEANATFVDGTYPVHVEAIKGNSDEQSATNEYIASTATVTIQNGKAVVTLTLKNATWWKSFTVNAGSGSFTDVKTISENKEANTRVVQFEANDLTQMPQAKIHIVVTGVPGFEYDNKYDIRFRLDTSNITAAPKETPSAPANSVKPSATPTPDGTASAAPSVKPKESTAPGATTNTIASTAPGETNSPASSPNATESPSPTSEAEGNDSTTVQPDETGKSDGGEFAGPSASDDANENKEETPEDEHSGVSDPVKITDEDEESTSSNTGKLVLYVIVALGIMVGVAGTIIMKKRKS